MTGAVTDTPSIGLDVDKIRRLRTAQKLTMEEAARRAGFANRQRWYVIETNQKPDVRVSTLEAIARALGVKPAELLK